MRSAKEIVYQMKEEMPFFFRESYTPYIIEAINIARIEAIKECAERAKLKYPLRDNEVNKQSILQLINELH